MTIDHDHGDGHHHHHGGLKHYHDEDMQSLVAQDRQAAQPRQVLPLGAGSGREGRAEHPALQGHPVVQGRSGALRVPGRAHDPRRRPPAAWKDGEKRDSRIVFIGRNLPEEKIRQGFESCAERCIARCSVLEAASDRRRLRMSTVTDTRHTRLRRRPHARGRRRRAGGRRAFPRPHRRVRARRGGAAAGRAASGDRSGASPCMAAASCRRPRDGERIVTGGDDGKVVVDRRQTATRSPIATDDKRRWIDHVAAGPDGAVGWSAGKTAFVRTGKGEARSLDVPSTRRRAGLRAQGLAARDRPLQRRVALVSERAGRARELEWKGSHLDVAFSPDGRFLVTAMQEPTLHGWRARRRQAHADVRLFGAGALVRLDRGRQVARDLAAPSSSCCGRSRARTARWARQPRMFAARAARLVVVACHPQQEVVAVGYADGTVLLVRIDDGAEVLAKKPATRRSRRWPGTRHSWPSGRRGRTRRAVIDLAH